MWLPRARTGPVVAQAAGELGQQGVFLDRLVDAVQVVGHRGQVAAGQLRAQRAAVEQRGRAAHEVEGRQQLVELDGARLAVDLVQRQAHGHAHEEGLRQLDALLAHVQEVAVVQGLQAQVVELQVALGGARAQARQVELQQRSSSSSARCPLDERGSTGRRRRPGRPALAQHLLRDGVQQQARGDVGVVGLALDQGARGQDGGLVHLLDGHAVVQVAQRLGQDGLGADVGVQAGAGLSRSGLAARTDPAPRARRFVSMQNRRCRGQRALGCARSWARRSRYST
jgi:hypothetical protein